MYDVDYILGRYNTALVTRYIIWELRMSNARLA